MTKLYTGCGDAGYTQTADNKHIKKHDLLIELLGTIDEFNAFLGIAGLHIKEGRVAKDIRAVQKNLILLMSELAGYDVFADNEKIAEIEHCIDSYQGEFTGLTPPGKNQAAAYLNAARCICRRAERIAAALYEKERINCSVLVYLNRLSDLIYAMGSFCEKI